MTEAEPSQPRSAAHSPPARPRLTSPSSGRSRRSGPWVIAALVVLLLILHQDYWFWTSDYLVFGWAPIGLFYHACLSVFASLVWLLATRIAWPVETIQQAQLAAAADDKESQP